jgi:hypothetical protein
MTLLERIRDLYPELTVADFLPGGSILLQNDSDGLGDYIKTWSHPTLPHPPFGHDPHLTQPDPVTRK